MRVDDSSVVATVSAVEEVLQRKYKWNESNVGWELIIYCSVVATVSAGEEVLQHKYKWNELMNVGWEWMIAVLILFTRADCSHRERVTDWWTKTKWQLEHSTKMSVVLTSQAIQ